MTDDVTTWRALAALLPCERAREVLDLRAIGEQESALAELVSGLLEHDIPITEDVRVQLVVTAEDWGSREALVGRIAQCRPALSPRSRLRLIDSRGDSTPVAFGSPPELSGLPVLPWIACESCGQLLARAHTREPWGGMSFLAVHYVIYQPGTAAPEFVFGATEVQRALGALSSCSQ
ncbi:hypothetical protein ACFU93_27140 [Streptomyces sp. NPDC057611]|uniref:hypothetical protein n=1 Tax=Streptomyces sp. NPDC057611 TaxID=3346182 RepID=UPI003682A8FF